VKAFTVLAFVVQLTLPVFAANELGEQSVTPIAPAQEQRVEQVSPGAEQRVEMVDVQGMQAVGQGTKGPAQRAAETTGKVVLGVVAFAVSVGVTVATLLFI
jgi:hypothetical protein